MTYKIARSGTGRAVVAALFVVVALAQPVGCTDDGPTDPAPIDQLSNGVIPTWNTIARDALVAHDEYTNALAAARLYAMMHLAQHDAINAIDPVFATYAFDGYDVAAHPVAAAAAAAHGVLSELFPEQHATFDQQLALSSANIPEPRQDAWHRAGRAGCRRHSGSPPERRLRYAYGRRLRACQRPGPLPVHSAASLCFGSRVAYVRPFALTSGDQFRSAPPPELGSAPYAADLNEVKAVGHIGSETRSQEQSATAKFWYEFSDIGWNRIARSVAAERQLGLQSAARLFALLNMALSDAYVAGWDSKYHYDLWRPYTAIHEADTDGNPATFADEEWEPAEPTPPVQDYPSTHSALGDAAATVLAAVFGDDTPITVTSSTAQPVSSTRTFASFSQAADENADSRVMGGLHFRFACDAGQELGRKVGEWTLGNHLRKQ